MGDMIRLVIDPAIVGFLIAHVPFRLGNLSRVEDGEHAAHRSEPEQPSDRKTPPRLESTDEVFGLSSLWLLLIHGLGSGPRNRDLLLVLAGA